jgi:hypothetical protein
MDSTSEMVHVEPCTHVEAQLSKVNMDLGANQLIWPRRNVTSFKYAKEHRLRLRLNTWRAALIAGHFKKRGK